MFSSVSLSKNVGLLHRVGVNIHAERANGNDIRQRAERLLLNLHLGRLVHLHRRVDPVRSHAPQFPGTCKFRSVDFELDALLGVRRVENCNGERLSIFTESRDFDALSVALFECGSFHRLVAETDPCKL